MLPAHAGMIRCTHEGARFDLRAPRSRGDDPSTRVHMNSRGTVLPAHAGMIRR